MSVSCDCYMLSGRGPCDGPITRPDDCYQLLCVYLHVIEELQTEGLGALWLSSSGGGGKILFLL